MGFEHPPQADDAKTPCYSCQPWLEIQPQISFFAPLCRDAPGQAVFCTQHGHGHARAIHRLGPTLPSLLPGFWGAIAAPLLLQGPNAARCLFCPPTCGCGWMWGSSQVSSQTLHKSKQILQTLLVFLLAKIRCGMQFSL